MSPGSPCGPRRRTRTARSPRWDPFCAVPCTLTRARGPPPAAKEVHLIFRPAPPRVPRQVLEMELASRLRRHHRITTSAVPAASNNHTVQLGATGITAIRPAPRFLTPTGPRPSFTSVLHTVTASPPLHCLHEAYRFREQWPLQYQRVLRINQNHERDIMHKAQIFGHTAAVTGQMIFRGGCHIDDSTHTGTYPVHRGSRPDVWTCYASVRRVPLCNREEDPRAHIRTCQFHRGYKNVYHQAQGAPQVSSLITLEGSVLIFSSLALNHRSAPRRPF